MENTDMADGDNSKIDQAISALMDEGLIDADDDEIIDGLQPFDLSMDEAVEVWNLIDEIRNETGTGASDTPDISEDEAEEIGKSIDNAYKGGKKGIQESKSNPVTKETELDTDADGDPDVTITEQDDGSDSEPTKETKDNSSESEDEPNEKKLNSNVVNAVSEHRF